MVQGNFLYRKKGSQKEESNYPGKNSNGVNQIRNVNVQGAPRSDIHYPVFLKRNWFCSERVEEAEVRQGT